MTPACVLYTPSAADIWATGSILVCSDISTCIANASLAVLVMQPPAGKEDRSTPLAAPAGRAHPEPAASTAAHLTTQLDASGNSPGLKNHCLKTCTVFVRFGPSLSSLKGRYTSLPTERRQCKCAALRSESRNSPF